MYYTSQRKAKTDVRGGFEMSGSSVSAGWDLPGQKAPTQFLMQLSTVPGRKYYFAAETGDSLSAWLDSFRSVTHQIDEIIKEQQAIAAGQQPPPQYYQSGGGYDGQYDPAGGASMGGDPHGAGTCC